MPFKFFFIALWDVRGTLIQFRSSLVKQVAYRLKMLMTVGKPLDTDCSNTENYEIIKSSTFSMRA